MTAIASATMTIKQTMIHKLTSLSAQTKVTAAALATIGLAVLINMLQPYYAPQAAFDYLGCTIANLIPPKTDSGFVGYDYFWNSLALNGEIGPTSILVANLALVLPLYLLIRMTLLNLCHAWHVGAKLDAALYLIATCISAVSFAFSAALSAGYRLCALATTKLIEPAAFESVYACFCVYLFAMLPIGILMVLWSVVRNNKYAANAANAPMRTLLAHCANIGRSNVVLGWIYAVICTLIGGICLVLWLHVLAYIAIFKFLYKHRKGILMFLFFFVWICLVAADSAWDSNRRRN